MRFKKRNKEHFTAALKSQPGSADTSDFYLRYPSINNPNTSNLLRSGHFEDLVQYIGLAFDRDGDTSALTATKGGLFNWSNETISRTNAMHVSSCKTMRERQLVFYSTPVRECMIYAYHLLII